VAPFQHCPGDNNATGAAGAVTLASGDTVVFKGGVTYDGYINCPSNGVTYDGNSAGAFGTGRPVFSGQNSTTQLNGFTAVGKSGLIFNNLEMTLYGGHGSIPWTGTETRGFYGYALYLDECSQVTVQNCYFHGIGDWQNVAKANEGYMEGVGIAVIDNGSAITITGNEFTQIGRAGILIEPKQGTQICTNIAITGNNFHDYIRWGVWLATGNTNCTLNAVTINGNQFHDIYQYDTNDWLGLPNDAPHVDCIIAYIGNVPAQGGQSLGTAANPITICNNFFYNNALVTQVQNSAVFLTSWGGRVLIHDNVFINTLYNGNGAIFCLEGTDTSINPAPDYWICNNSFYDTTYAVTLESAVDPLNNGDIHILNNIFYKPDTSSGYSVRVMDNNSAPTQLDYNVYFTARPDNQLAFTPAGYQTLAQLQRQGYEQHGIQADPQYLNIAFGLGASSSSNDLHLQATSPAIGAALNLSALFSADKDGNTRPTGQSAWDAGAYEFAGVASAVTAAAVVTAPVVTAPVVTPTVAAAAVVTAPVVIAPAVTVPVVAAPVVTAPVVTDPVVTIPVVTSPATSTSSSAAPASRLINFSVRAFSSVGANTLIAGFSVSGGSKQILMRGIGPGLAAQGVTGFLTNPEISLYAVNAELQSNAGWGGAAALASAFGQTGAFPLAPTSLDAALLATTPVGSYSMQVTSGAGSGVALAELYDADTAAAPAGTLANFSGRAWVGTGSNILIAGFAISGNAPETVLIRAVGPSLAQLGVTGCLANPQIALFQNSTLLQQNDNWGGTAALTAAFAQVGAFPLTSPQDAAMIVTLQPGQYTAQVSGVGGCTGVALIEVYQMQ